MDIEKVYDMPFSPEAVYAAWVSSDTVIPPATAMDINPVVGGHYRLVVKSDEWDTQNEGKFLEVEENKHLRYTWEWNQDGDVTEIEVTFGWDGYIKGLAAFMDAPSG